MTGNIPQVAATVFLGSILTLDRMAFGQFCLSRPFFAASLLGWVLGCPSEGVFIGIIYELLFLRSIPAGSFIPLHPLHGSLIAVLLLASGSAGNTGWSAVPPALFFSLPAVWVDRSFEVFWRRSNERSLLKATALVRMGNVRFARGVHVGSIFKASLFSAGALLLSGIVLTALSRFTTGQFPSAAAYLSVAGLAPFFIGLAGVMPGRKFGFGRIGFISGLLLGALAGSGILF